MNVQQVVPFLRVSNIERSLRFYESLGFTKTLQWIDDGKLRWCSLDLGGASVMLQEFATGVGGAGISLCLICEDAVALYRELTARGVACSEPEVGNGMWVTTVEDPDGYRLDFESNTDAPEDTKLFDEVKPLT